MTSRYILSLILVLFLHNAYAQKPTVKEKEKFKLQINGVRLYTDVSSMFLAAIDANKLRLELGTELNISNTFFINAEYGISNRKTGMNDRTIYTYTNEGSYMRFGADYNFLHKILDKQALFIGGRFGSANFAHTLFYIPYDGYFNKDNASRVTLKESGLQLSWFEVVLGLRTNVYRGFLAGFTIRLQKELNRTDGALVGIAEVPGFARADKKAHLLLNYHLVYEFDLRRKR